MSDTSPIQYRGVDYRTLREVYEAQAAEGLSFACVRQRLLSGRTLESALSEPLNQGGKRNFLANGQVFLNLKALAKAANISYEAAVKRCHRGFSDEEIFSGRKKAKAEKVAIPNVDARAKASTVGGTDYSSIRAAYDAIKPSGLSFNAVRARLRYGYSLEEALGVVEKRDGRTHRTSVHLELNGEKIKISEASKKYSVPKATIRDRIMRGASPAQALGVAEIAPGDLLLQRSIRPLTPRVRSKQSYVVDGIEYPTVSVLSTAFGLSWHLVYQRIKLRKWTPEKAVKEPVADAVVIAGKRYRSAMNAWDEIGLELTPFHGHLIVPTEGVRSVQTTHTQAAVLGAIS